MNNIREMKNNGWGRISRLVFLSLVCTSCTSFASKHTTVVTEIPPTTGRQQENPTEASVTVNKKNWNAAQTIVKGAKFIERTLIISDLVLIAFDSKSLYRSNDGGKSWRPVKTFSNDILVDAYFSSENEGFVVTVEPIGESAPGMYTSRLWKSADGCRTWHLILSTSEGLFERIEFGNAGKGALVGRKQPSTTVLDTTNFVLLSKDFGVTWIDCSDNLNRLAMNSVGVVGDFITNAQVSDDEIMIVSSHGNIYLSSDMGVNWRVAAKLDADLGPASVHQFGKLMDGRYWLGESTISTEGKWGQISVSNGHGWDHVRLTNYFLSDIRFLSDNVLIACGSKVAETNYGGTNGSDEGVIMYSADQAKTWTIVHRSKSDKRYGSIAVMPDGGFLISGDNGSIIRLRESK